eukprot:TRINITY_DN7230_c0_g4_i1.p1 TRINITY_DN7230_c0_g4~~TRINITY_DN7230_c0_g4_i1.p1  ORF type:complete len:147 (+),score=14.68 TRINITY_DN7230_c0_g4_i1:75-515(+)
MIRRPPRSTLSSSSAASDVYKRQILDNACVVCHVCGLPTCVTHKNRRSLESWDGMVPESEFCHRYLVEMTSDHALHDSVCDSQSFQGTLHTIPMTRVVARAPSRVVDPVGSIGGIVQLQEHFPLEREVGQSSGQHGKEQQSQQCHS